MGTLKHARSVRRTARPGAAGHNLRTDWPRWPREMAEEEVVGSHSGHWKDTASTPRGMERGGGFQTKEWQENEMYHFSQVVYFYSAFLKYPASFPEYWKYPKQLPGSPLGYGKSPGTHVGNHLLYKGENGDPGWAMTSSGLACGMCLSMPRSRQPPTPEVLRAPLPKWEETAASSRPS